ncbi:peptide chain release factor 2 [Patescibacteria group bacterium AH-259-L07]|nr:peptide chain release factor 2 [Patescibacteria group bacterium AH-259-L07]
MFDIDTKKTKIKELEYEMAEPDFWQDKEQAEKKSRKLAHLNDEVKKWETMEKSITDLLEIAELDKVDKEVNLREEIETQFNNIEIQLNDFEKLTFLRGKHDRKNAYLSIFAGAGGVDAQDWTAMLVRMYQRYAEKKGWSAHIIDESKGSEAGIKSTTLAIEGEFAYGLLKSEAGVHRLVRISPFDAERMRHTSFALVEVLPEIEDVEVEINPDDLRIDTFLSSGPGGQHMQKTESAVRIMHLPTKLTAVCQSERSQHQNKEQAMRILKTKLYHFYSAEKEEEKDRLRGEFKSASWGNQIRSYVLHPYKMVKDLRTKYETNEVQSILDGDLDEIIESYLKFKK